MGGTVAELSMSLQNSAHLTLGLLEIRTSPKYVRSRSVQSLFSPPQDTGKTKSSYEAFQPCRPTVGGFCGYLGQPDCVDVKRSRLGSSVVGQLNHRRVPEYSLCATARWIASVFPAGAVLQYFNREW